MEVARVLLLPVVIPVVRFQEAWWLFLWATYSMRVYRRVFLTWCVEALSRQRGLLENLNLLLR
jgi:hypothetical protein